MVTKFSMPPDRVLFESDGRAVFDSDAWPVQFYRAEDQINLTGYSLTFPDFSLKGNAYAYSRGTIGGDLYGGCHSYATIGPEDTIDEEVIGTVPEGTDLLFVMVRLTRTSAPSQINGQDIPVLPEEGEFTFAPSGCVLIEQLPPMARMIQVAIDGTNVVLRKKQSVKRTLYTYWRSGNDANNTGWTYGGDAGPYGHAVYSIESKGPTFDPSGSNLKRGGAGGCSLTDPTDYSSEYTADFIILPGRSDIDADAGEFEGLPSIYPTGFFSATDDGPTITLEDYELGPTGPARRILIVVTYARSLDSAVDLDGVTIAGVAATMVAEARYTDNPPGTAFTTRAATLWIADVPDGETGDIALDFDTEVPWVVFETFSLYDLQSATPVDVFEDLDQDTTNALSTAADGVAFAAALGRPDFPPTLSGIENSLNIAHTVSSPAISLVHSRGYQLTDGSTLNIHDGDTAFSGTPFIGVSFR